MFVFCATTSFAASNAVSGLEQISVRQALDLAKLRDDKANANEFTGSWKRVFHVKLERSENDFGLLNEQGITNPWDRSQNRLIITHAASGWLPEGENTELRVLEQNIITNGNDARSRLALEGGSIVYLRSFAFLVSHYSACHDFICFESSSSRSFDTSETELMSMPDKKTVKKAINEKRGEHRYGKTKLGNSHNEVTIKCGLLYNDHNRMVCEWSSTQYSGMAAIVGFVRE